jgi:hypothetical protein
MIEKNLKTSVTYDYHYSYGNHSGQTVSLQRGMTDKRDETTTKTQRCMYGDREITLNEQRRILY